MVCVCVWIKIHWNVLKVSEYIYIWKYYKAFIQITGIFTIILFINLSVLTQTFSEAVSSTQK